MGNKKIIMGMVSLLLLFVLSACAGNSGNKDKHSNEGIPSSSHEEMDRHSDSGYVPKGLKKAKHPAFKVGSHAIVNSDHMMGMKGAQATIVGAFDTTVYAVSYTPTTGGERVNNHKWVIQQEIKDAGNKPFKPGEKVTLETDHMKGMKGAKAVIDSSQHTTVYMIDYKPTTGGKEVKNHKWVVGSELSKP
ncbi:YdhK family protein [Camelliibacillus cellulosilyticus]|uniref:YdhK family protein n=1 Tax=Camelliibacillus cellulosilyticus TaxID=2174486 RepID=A0ABV9GQM6_9BACL